MIVCLIIIAFFVFKAPKWAFLSIPLCIAYIAIKSKLNGNSTYNNIESPDEEDELFEDDL